MPEIRERSVLDVLLSLNTQGWTDVHGKGSHHYRRINLINVVHNYRVLMLLSDADVFIILEGLVQEKSAWPWIG